MEGIIIVLALGALCGIGGISLWRQRSQSGREGKRALSITGGLILGPRTKLLVIEGFGPPRLISLSQGNVTLLASKEESKERGEEEGKEKERSKHALLFQETLSSLKEVA